MELFVGSEFIRIQQVYSQMGRLNKSELVFFYKENSLGQARVNVGDGFYSVAAGKLKQYNTLMSH